MEAPLCRVGSIGERLYDWALMPLSKQDGWTRALLVRRSIEEKPECAYYLCYAPSGKDTIETLVRVAANAGRSSNLQNREGESDWITTKCATAGLVSAYHAVHVAHAVLSVLRARGEKIPHAQVRRSVRELRHLLTAMLWRGWHGVEHLLHWSKWRRRINSGPCAATIESADQPCPHVSTTVVRSEQYYV